MSYFTSKLSNFTGQTDENRLRDYLLAVDMDLVNLFNVSSIFYQFGTGTNYSILTYTSTNYVWFPSVGAWNITNSLLYGGSGASYIGLQPSVGIWLGDAAFANAVFSVDPTGQMKAHAGRIGGWYIGTTTLSSTNLIFDSSNELVKTSNYVSGVLGRGWQIDNNKAEFQNIRARGKITTSVFEKAAISSIGGNFLISDSDILNADMTASDTSTMTALGLTRFATNDILRIKDGTDDEWFTITGSTSALGYTVSRDQKGNYAVNNNPIWKAGTAVVNFGINGEGLIFMTASETNNPYLDVVTHSGSPWTTLTTRLRLGNLNGFLGYATDRYGIAIGETNNYLKYDPTDGLQVRGNITTSSLTACTISASAINTSTLTSVTINTSTLTSITINASVITASSSYTGATISTAYTQAKATDPNADETGSHTALNVLSVSNLAASYISGWAHGTDVTKIDGGDIYVGSSIVLGSSGFMRSGQTGYNVGTGWWIGDIGGTPKFSIGNSASNISLTWDGTKMEVSNVQSRDYISTTTGYKLSAIDGFEMNTGTIQGTPLISKLMVYAMMFGS